MMDTPICDFVRTYAKKNALRLHMPGHKGTGPLGAEALDITEIDGADSLYEASGIIRQSEENASSLFGCPTFYSAEGSSLAIRAMLYLLCLQAKAQNRRALIAAGRNAHKVFLSAAALLDFDVLWLYPTQEETYLHCQINAASLEKALAEADERPIAVYLTSPDYLGNMLDLRAIAEICHRHGILLLVDNAHGAYLRFLSPSLHPIDLGADLCCDSAHKTLPVLTGGAYLHIAQNAPRLFHAQAKNALALFGSTSPSYLILQSLDAANRYLSDGYAQELASFIVQMKNCKARLKAHGYCLVEDEPLKLTIDAKAYGYTGTDLARILRENEILCEFADPDFVVLMCTPQIGANGLDRLERALSAIPRRALISEKPPVCMRPERVCSPRQASLSPCEVIPANRSEGRVLALSTVSCPPAIPIVVSGERIDASAIRCFQYYGIRTCCVVKPYPRRQRSAN